MSISIPVCRLYLQVMSNLQHTHVTVSFGVYIMYFGLRGEGWRIWEGMEWIWIIWLHWNHLNLVFSDKYFTFNLHILGKQVQKLSIKHKSRLYLGKKVRKKSGNLYIHKICLNFMRKIFFNKITKNLVFKHKSYLECQFHWGHTSFYEKFALNENYLNSCCMKCRSLIIFVRCS